MLSFRPQPAAGGEPAGVDALPIDPPARRLRIRRGGPRTPLPLLPVIAVVAGIGIAYVSQTAHVTQATYRATNLAAAQQQLVAQDAQLAEELARLKSSERIIAAAQQLGMHPAGRWANVASSRPAVIAGPPGLQLAGAAGGDALQELVAALSGAFGSTR